MKVSRHLVIRAVTAFVQVTSPKEQQAELRQVREQLTRLRARLETLGFSVQTLRVAFASFTSWGNGLEAVQEQVEVVLDALGPEVFVSLGQVLPHQEAALTWLPQLMGRYRVYASMPVVAPGETRISGQAVWRAARLIHQLAQVGLQGEGNTRFAAAAWVPPYTPFFPVSYADPAGPVTGPWALALETGGLLAWGVAQAGSLEKRGRLLIQVLEEETGVIAHHLAQHEPELWKHFRGFDCSWAPYPHRERSVGAALEQLVGGPVGSHGTLAAAAWLTAVLRQARMPKTGYCGLMLPVLEDPVLAQALARGSLEARTLLVYSAVCGVGLDTLPLPGDTTPEQLAAVLWDLTALAVRLRKPLAARLIPVPGLKAGQWTRWKNPFFTDTPATSLLAPSELLWGPDAEIDLG